MQSDWPALVPTVSHKPKHAVVPQTVILLGIVIILTHIDNSLQLYQHVSLQL